MSKRGPKYAAEKASTAMGWTLVSLVFVFLMVGLGVRRQDQLCPPYCLS
jgi:hypothetical protein